MRAFERGKDLGAAHGLVAQQEEDAHRLGLADDLDQVEFEESEVAHLLGGLLADDDVDVIGLGLAFEPRGDVGVVAQHRIVEALIRAEIADDAAARVEADAEREPR